MVRPRGIHLSCLCATCTRNVAARITHLLPCRSARQQARQLERARQSNNEQGRGGSNDSQAVEDGSLRVAALEDALRREKEVVRRLRITLREQAAEMKETLAAAVRAKVRPDATQQARSDSRVHLEIRCVLNEAVALFLLEVRV